MGDNFPLKSTEFIKGGPQYNDYIHALDKVRVYCKWWGRFQCSFVFSYAAGVSLNVHCL